MKIRSGQLTSTGGRDYNEDHLGDGIAGPLRCYVVADGLGGHGGGDVAAHLAVDGILHAFQQKPQLEAQTLETYIQHAHQVIIQQQQADSACANMRSTVVVLVISAEQAQWAHVGDSRLYLFREGQCYTRTKDHSVPQALADAGDIPEAMIRYHEDRNRLLRTLGNDSQPLKPTVLSQPLPLQRDDAFLLCSDGFWEYVTEPEMEAELAKTQDPQDWLYRMERRVLRRAPQEHDNYTASTLWITG